MADEVECVLYTGMSKEFMTSRTIAHQWHHVFLTICLFYQHHHCNIRVILVQGTFVWCDGGTHTEFFGQVGTSPWLPSPCSLSWGCNSPKQKRHPISKILKELAFAKKQRCSLLPKFIYQIVSGPSLLLIMARTRSRMITTTIFKADGSSSFSLGQAFGRSKEESIFHEHLTWHEGYGCKDAKIVSSNISNAS